jgi:hypothetical protein
MWHAWESGEKCKGFWWEGPKERHHLEDQGVDGRTGLGFGGGGVWSVFTLLWVGTRGGLW